MKELLLISSPIILWLIILLILGSGNAINSKGMGSDK